MSYYYRGHFLCIQFKFSGISGLWVLLLSITDDEEIANMLPLTLTNYFVDFYWEKNAKVKFVGTRYTAAFN